MITPLASRSPSVDPGGTSAGSADPTPAADGIERRRHPRIRLDEGGVESAATALRASERRPGGERKTGGGLRDNVGWTVSHKSDKRFSGLRKGRVKKSRLFVLGVAVIAGGFAFYLSSQIGRPSAPPVTTAAAPGATVQVLVASQHVAPGQRLTASSLAWQAWPEKALQSDYITAAAAPAAMTDLTKFMARSEILPGDPIRRQKLTEGAGGYLSAALGKGMRGVSVAVSAEAASGGFVSPNDRVDVVLTYTPPGGIAGSVPRSVTILRNVRVLAINSKVVEPGSLGPPPDEQRDNTFAGQAIATLALGPSDADLVVSAAAMGKLTLLLRSSVEASAAGKTAEAQDSLNQTIRMTSPFWLK